MTTPPDPSVRRLQVDHVIQMIRLIHMPSQPTAMGTLQASGSRMIQLIHSDRRTPPPPPLLRRKRLIYADSLKWIKWIKWIKPPPTTYAPTTRMIQAQPQFKWIIEWIIF